MDVPIFTIWLTKNNWDAMPYIYELFIASWHIFNPNRDVIIYTNNELHLSFLDRHITKIRKLDEFFPGLYEQAKNITDNIQHQSDFIRYYILSKTNGIYLDTDVLLYNSIDEILYKIQENNKYVMFSKEDENMLCNAFIIKLNKKVNSIFEDIVDNYKNNYIIHSYLFNSQKYLWLIWRRYNKDIILLDDTIFKPGFMDTEDKFELIKNNIHTYKGIGFHLTSTNNNYKILKQYLDINCYNKTPQNEIQQLMTVIINRYINLMKEEQYEDS